MNSRLIILFVSSVILFSFNSCSKDEVLSPTKSYTINGTLYRDCFSPPLKNVDLELWQNAPNGLNYGGLLDQCTTDDNGFYEFNFPSKKGMELFIRFKASEGGNIIHEYIPKDTSIYDLDLYFHPTVNIEVHLDVENPYTKNDTLIINNLIDPNGLKLAGPFRSGFVFRSEDVFLFNQSMKSTHFKIGYAILPDLNSSGSEYFTINEYCDNTIKVTLNID